jgi:hypothetical protein
MATPFTSRPVEDGRSPLAVAPGPSGPSGAVGVADYRLPGTWQVITAQTSAALGMLAGLWAALSPWFITLQHGGGGNARVTDVIAGLAATAVGGLALASPRGYAGLQLGSLLLGAWLIISPVVLDRTYPIAHPMYWSNSWAGGVLAALALVGLTAASRRPARR